MSLIRPASLIDPCPFAITDRGYAVWLSDEPAPSVAPGFDDGIVGGEHAVAELIAAQEGPDIFDRIRQVGLLERGAIQETKGAHGLVQRWS